MAADLPLRMDATTVTGTFTVHARFCAPMGVTVLFGPSGAGKSVTLATIAGLLRPVQGTVHLSGDLVADGDRGIHVPTQKRRLGMVFQQGVLLPHRSPLDNVALAVRDRVDRRQVAYGWLERVHATHLASAPTTSLSGGEQQRIALARALAGDPRLLLLDEPFSALDRPTREALRTMVREVVDDQGIAALLVTHDGEDADELADRVVRYEPGRTTGVEDRDR